MQRHTSKETDIKIPPNLLKNFNVYEILEPQKNGAKNSDAVTVDKLIDIDDCSGDSGFQDSDLHPAFLDKNRDFDLVDLYQNIFVTPQHIKTKETEEVDTSDATLSDSNVFDAGFKNFFDMLESGEKVDWSNIAKLEEETITKKDFIENKPRVLIPKVFTEPDSDPEDVIYEVLNQKNLEKIILDSVSDAPKNNSSPMVNASEPKELESCEIKKSDVIPELSRFYSVNGIAKGSKFKSGINENLPRPSETYMVNSSTKFTVRAIQKDEKVYKKKRVQKPESQTANFTKGPDFYEKTVVLPQIMARLEARLALIHEKDNQKRRLILDTGSKSDKAEQMTNANTGVKKIPDNCSSKPKPKAQVIPTKKEPNKVPNKASSSGINSINLNNTPIQKEAQLCINKITKDIRVHTTDKPCLNCGKFPAAQKVQDHVAATSRTDYGKLSPVVLMEDCNRERLRALRQSQMFKDFVLKAKFDA